MAFDHQIFLRQARGGISRYFTELIRNYSNRADLGVRPVLRQALGVNHHLAQAIPGQHVLHPIPSRFWGAALRAEQALIRKRQSVDILHHTYYDAAALEDAGGVPVVSTVHDMIPELLPEHFPEGNPHLDKALYIERSDLVLCVSEATRTDLLRLHPGCAGRAVVVHLACSSVFAVPHRRPPWAPPQYVLFVGARGGYKDFEVLLQAYASSGLDIPLVCAGGGPWSEAEQERILDHGLSVPRVTQRDVSDEELIGLYQHAMVFVFPSSHEGFGLPVLEAMTAGCPVVISDARALVEVAGDASARFARGDAGRLADVLVALWDEPDLQQDLRERGRARADAYSWERTADRTAVLYRELLAGR